jgi:RHS repeat-associated protein
MNFAPFVFPEIPSNSDLWGNRLSFTYHAPTKCEFGNTYNPIFTTDSMFYIHTDHLGSYCALTDIYGTVVQRNSFDPWGNYAFEQMYICSTTHPRGDTLLELSFPITRRGFTGHEHYPELKIINMNGRLYDPVIARFFSPDKYVANSSFTQDFNRYSYARNNPLMYTDPDGEFIQYIFGAIMGGFSGWQIGKAAGAKGWAMFGYIIGGAGIGAATAGIGTAITSSISAAGFAGSAIVGSAVGGAVSGAVSGAAFTGLAGGNPLDGMWKGALSGLAGGLTSSVIGGGAGAFAGGFTSSATGAILNGAKGGDILKSALIGGALSWGSYEIQMGLSYRQYNRSDKPFGNLKYSGFHKISVASQRSFAWGVESAGWITNDGTVGKIAYGGKDWVKMPDKPYNGIANFHTHPNSSPLYLQSHNPQDVRGETNVNYVIAQNNICKHDPAIRSFSANLSLNYIKMVMPTSQGFNSYSNSLYLYPFFWFYFGQ